MRATEALPLLHAALADVRNADDLAARAAASQALSRLIAAAAAAGPAPGTGDTVGGMAVDVPPVLGAGLAAAGDAPPEEPSEQSGAKQRDVLMLAVIENWRSRVIATPRRPPNMAGNAVQGQCSEQFGTQQICVWMPTMKYGHALVVAVCMC